MNHLSTVGLLFLLAASLYCTNAEPLRGRISVEPYSVTFLPEIPAPRQEHAITLLQDRIFLVGGLSSNYSYTPDTITAPSTPVTVDTVQSYNIKTRSWTDHKPAPYPVNHGNIAAVKGRIYLLGGLMGGNFSRWGAVTNSYVYDIRKDTWKTIAPMPSGTERGASAMGVRGSKIYLAGGMRFLDMGGETSAQASVALVSSYDTETNTWNTDLPSLPESRDHVGGAVIGNTFYVAGGRDRGQHNVRGDTWALDLKNTTSGWRRLASMPTARGGLSATAVGHCLYTFGGEGNAEGIGGVFANVEVYDTKQNTWEALPALWAGIHGTNAITGGDGKIYIAGGGYRLGAGPSNFTIAYQPHSKCFA